MPKSVLLQMKERRSSYDRAAIVKSIEEMEYIERSRKLLFQLLKAEHETPSAYTFTCNHAPGEAVQVITCPFPVDNQFVVKSACTQYDTFENVLLANDFANWLSKLRAQAADPCVYGPNAAWEVFYITRASFTRYSAEGRLSAVVRTFPDLITAISWQLAGVVMPPGVAVPSFIVRRSVFNELAQLFPAKPQG